MMVHVGGHLREAFEAVVVDAPERYKSVWHDEPMPVPNLLWSMANCSDVMPKDMCEDLRLPQGSTYAMGAGAYIAINGMPEE